MTSRARTGLVELLVTGVVLLAATASGAALTAVAVDGRYKLHDLLIIVGLPAAVVIVVVLIAAMMFGWRRLRTGIVHGFWIGLVATIGLEAVRITGFRVFESMPGDLPRLIGVWATGRSIMDGPSLASDLAGYGLHFWSGAMFGVTYALLLGGFPATARWWPNAVAGMAFGALIATGFLASPVPMVVGAGPFGQWFGPRFAVTVYLAHLLFGAILGLLTRRFAVGLDPVWTPVLRLSRR